MKRLIKVLLMSSVLVLSLVVLSSCSNQGYTPEKKEALVPDSSLVSAGTLTVGVNASNPPMAGQSSTIVGIDVDMAAAIADELGLKLNIVDVKNDGDNALQNKQVDVVFGVDSSLNAKSGIWTSDDYIKTGIAYFSTSSGAQAPKESDKTKFSAQASSVSAWHVTNQFGASRLVATSDLSSAFNNLMDGTVDFAVADAIVGMYAANMSKLNVYIVAMANKPTGYCVSALSSNTGLQKYISDALKTLLNNGIANTIQKKWLGTSLQLINLPVTDTSDKTANEDNSNTTDESNNSMNTSDNVSSNENANTNSGSESTNSNTGSNTNSTS